MTKEQARTLAEPIVKAVVDSIADKKYQDILLYAGFKDDGISLDMLQEIVEGFLESNELPCIDKYGVDCPFCPAYVPSYDSYNQLEVYIGEDRQDFSVDYDLTTNGDINDLTLQMDFVVENDGTIKAFVMDAHVL